MKGKRYIFICVFILSIACLFAGCGNVNQSQESENRNTEGSISASAANKDDTEPQKVEEFHSENGAAENIITDVDKEQKILVAYFSRADENYNVGYVEKGNTAIIAEMIAEETGGELFHIERAVPYPAVYDECTEEAKQEQKDNARPELMEDKDISAYGVIFLGFAGGIIGLN